MQKPMFQVLYSFQNGNGQLFEVKRLNIESNDPSDIYFWFLYAANQETLERLSFVSMDQEKDNEIRTFKQGKLRFNAEIAEFTNETTTLQFAVDQNHHLPSLLAMTVANYFRLISTYRE